ncbi:MAG TPA: YdbH family protein [Arsenophonus apicola]|uniref:YdbH family protein n=1 Tax=Arsenophonus apicola TaxID=2879119 RepID=UPI001CDC095D|nr:YdbH family protein [Arsenophonus apicola]UBX27859.1 YdbH family protein [Arsenophonus apicola]
MPKLIKYIILLFIILLFITITSWLSIPHWLPRVSQLWLPKGAILSLSVPKITGKGIVVADIKVTLGNCEWIKVNQLTASTRAKWPTKWIIHTQSLVSDNNCLSRLKDNQTAPAEIDIKQILTAIPALEFTIEQLVLQPWPFLAGKLELQVSQSHLLDINYQGQNIQFVARTTAADYLNIEHFFLRLNDDTVNLTGNVALPLSATLIPEHGKIDATLITNRYAKPLVAQLNWSSRSGTLQLTTQQSQFPLLDLPWQLDDQYLTIKQGKWRWQNGEQLLSGKIDLRLANWRDSLANMRISGRANMLTTGEKGKANLVLTVEQGKLDWLNSHIPFQLMGQVKINDLIIDMRTPTLLSGPLLSPRITFLPSSLIRMYGKINKTLTLDELRLPLAGTYLTSQGVTGRLQAIAATTDSYWGKVKLHFDGQANNFKPDQGEWRWHYWGNAHLHPLKANWDLSGDGYWINSLLVVNRLNTGFDKIQYGMVNMIQPRLTLLKPLKWQRDAEQANFAGELILHTNRIRFGNDSFLPASAITSKLVGRNPADFQLTGALSAQQIGPIPYFIRWDGIRLRGNARWQKQSVLAFQSLIPPDLGITLREGNFYAQAAFSVAQGQGVIAGGHWSVDNAGLWLKDGSIDEIDFILPWRLQNSRWQLGTKSPVKIRIKQINSLFNMRNVAADLNGYYPATAQFPLVLRAVNIDLLGGSVRLAKLRWPQTTPATLTIDRIDLSQLLTRLRTTSQVAMSGKISGQLPFFLDNPDWIVKEGWLANSGNITLRLGKELVDSIGENNLSARVAMAWLRYLEINRSHAKISLSNLGDININAQIYGFNPLESKNRQVHLNYYHQENIFQLWRSLQFGNNLGDWLEKNISLKKGENQ